MYQIQKRLKPCRSPYCECDEGKCTHPGCYDARGIATDKWKPRAHYGKRTRMWVVYWRTPDGRMVAGGGATLPLAYDGYLTELVRVAGA